MTSPHYGRYPVAKSRNPFTCGLTGKTFSHAQWNERRESLARAVGKRLGWLPNEETEWDKVACMFSFNTVRTVPAPLHQPPPPLCVGQEADGSSSSRRATGGGLCIDIDDFTDQRTSRLTT